MADMKELILTVVRPLVTHPEELDIVIEEPNEYLEYQLSVHPDDIGRVIGKQGRVAKSIRTIVYSVRVNGPKRVRLSIVE
ncbi:KH domain-containing protein [Carnobacterium divergens]|uniref:KH domain-containing protein n=1 Tax=Carnobacterium divergens TaxID=2748 RepID=UPI001072365B|nr:KH domain-containing protein [Carnobacterium divergens]TFI70632.1 RNA-binding protein [Carnobacterium divergens]